MLKPEPHIGIWLVPSLFLGIISFGLLLTCLMRCFLGKERYKEYEVGSQARFNIHNRAWLWLLSLFSVFLGLAIFLAQDWYTRFDEERIAINPLLGVGERVYSYEDIDRLVETSHLKAPIGTIVERKRWFIVFSHSRWCNEDSSSSASQGRADQELRDFLTTKTGKQFEQVRFIEDIPHR